MALQLSPMAWALLSMLKRAKEGGPVAPAGFELEYAELEAKALVARISSKTVITEKGVLALFERLRES